ncbi:MAG: TIGR03960 family B12-binding radical SAM protein [Planctomycetes bacterium]|nr:TIGR03960 family B12-binding radical SAM protein [Planctomycetota bacterium]
MIAKSHSPATITQFMTRNLARVEKPAQYVGGELNQIRKDPAALSVRSAFLYPDVYEIGMSHLGLRILYHIINERPAWSAERAFHPGADMETAMREAGVPLWSLETRTPLCQFDIVGFTLQYEMSYTNIVCCLDLGGIPIRREDRSLEHPIVIAGGAGALNPEVIADFIDLFVLGDGEDAIVQFFEAYESERGKHATRRELLRALVEKCKFLYAPEFWEPSYLDDGRIREYKALDGVAPSRRSVVYDLENAPFPTKPVIAHTQTVHDRITIEIMRGCVQGCKFCQAGYEKRPQRFRSKEKVLEIARESYINTGHDEIGLTSLSSSDHPELGGMMDLLNAEFGERRVNLSLPSLRVNEQVMELPKRIKSVRKSGLTLAPEVASNRLRRIINKNILNEDLYNGAEEAWKNGWKTIKLYFMIGIPGEIESDLREIVTMAETVSRLRQKAGRGGAGKVNAAVSTFVPKPHTPFQWHGQMPLEQVRQHQRQLYHWKNDRAVELKMHDSERSVIEGVLSRADRRLGRAIETAWRMGCHLDAWDPYFQYDLWLRAFAESGIDPIWYANRPRKKDEVFAWDHIDGGVNKLFQWIEYEKSIAQVETPECQVGGCGDCGVGARNCVSIKAVTGYFGYSMPAEKAKFKEPKWDHAADAAELAKS